jgi:hypothetical protein
MTSVDNLNLPHTTRTNEILDPSKPRTHSHFVLPESGHTIFEMSHDDLIDFQSKVVQQLNLVLDLHSIPQLSQQFIKQHQQSIYGTQPSWFSFFWYFRKENRILE